MSNKRTAREYYISPMIADIHHDEDIICDYDASKKSNFPDRDFIHVREVLPIPKDGREINSSHLKQLAEELILKNPTGAMYVSPQVVHALFTDVEELNKELEGYRSGMNCAGGCR